MDIEKHNFSEEEIAEMMNPALAQKKAREKKHKDFMLAAMAGDLEDNAGPYERRCIVESDCWYVTVKANGEFETVTTKPGQYQALIAGISKADGRRTVKEGQGGQFLEIFQEKPDRPHVELDGRKLVSSLPTEITGLLVQTSAEGPRELYAEHFQALRDLAAAVEIEDALMADTIDAATTAKILAYNFRVAMNGERFWSSDHVVPIATFADFEFFDDESTTNIMSGQEIFEQLLADATYGGIIVNKSYEIGRHGEHIHGLLFSMNSIEIALKGSTEWRLPEYVVRSREEFELWLKHVFFPSKQREIVEEKDEQGRLFVYAVSHEPESQWNIRECEWTEAADLTITPKFEIRTNTGSANELGNGISPLLCPGLIAKQLWLQLPEKDRRENKWSPGRSLGIARQLSDEDLAKSKLRVRLANELLKFIPAGEELLPSNAVRSVEGARFLDDNWCPAAKSRKWSESVREQGERYSKKMILGFGA